MADTSSSDFSVAWLKLIEYLATFHQIEPSILHGFIENGPKLPDDLSKNTREMVALRCLDHLFGPNNNAATDVPSTLEPKGTFSFSESCEHALQSILRKTSILDLKMVGPDLLKWDFLPFIAHKRASMPNCSLEQLKDAILKGTHSHAAYLFEHSGLVHTNDQYVRFPVDYNSFNAPLAGDSISLPLENKNRMVGGDSCIRNLFPFKRNGSDLIDKSSAGDYQEDQGCIHDGHLHVNAKRSKKDASCTDPPEEQISVPPQCNELAKNSSVRMVAVTEKGSRHVEKESQVGASDKSRSLEDGHGNFVSVSMLGQSAADADVNNEFQHNQCENAYISNKMLQDTSGDGPRQYILVDEIDDEDEPRASNKAPAPSLRIQQKVSIDESKDDSKEQHYTQRKIVNTASLNGSHWKIHADKVEVGLEHCCGEGTSDFNQYRHYVAMKKSQFLGSRCTIRQDSLAAVDWTEQNLCVICGKDGQVLACSAVGCPLVFHEECLGSSSRFDEKGDFYCPFCAYSRDAAWFVEAKKKSSLARKELTAFIHHSSECTKRSQSKK